MKWRLGFAVSLFVALHLQPVSETVEAQERGPTQGGTSQHVPPGAVRARSTVGPTAPQPGRADGSGNPELGGARRPLYRLAKSDVLEVIFTFTPEFNQTVTIQPDGLIALRSVGPLLAEGRTAPELEDAIRRCYAAFLHDPEVTVVLKEFERPFFIASGEVGHPGKYELRSDTTVAEAVAIAGGFTPQAKHSQVILFRRVTPDLVEARVLDIKQILKQHNLNEDIHLEAGDFLVVPKSAMAKVMRYMPTTSMGMFLTSGKF